MAYTTINKSTDYFNTKLYTGNGSTQSITGVGFQPDFTWIKPRSQAEKHSLTDAVRGAGKVIQSDTNIAEFTNTDYISSFISDGFSIGSNFRVNTNSTTYASWNWKANGAGVANTDGSISSTVSASTTSGFSIVKWTGSGATATIGHGLGSVPKMIIVKNRYTTQNWIVYHSALGSSKHLKLNLTDAEATTGGTWNHTDPTSSVFTVHTNANVNASGNSMMAYCFAEIPGYSKFGSYAGNGSTDGTFVYTGFKPVFIIYKAFSGPNSADNWEMADNKRSPYNGVENVLYPNLSNAEGTGVTTRLDLLSNGFKMRTGATDYNGSGVSYIYMAFGQSLVGSNNIPCTAR